MARVHLSLGSNLGDRIANLRRALEMLAAHIVVESVSHVYESEPMYRTEQPLFYNIALRGNTQHAPLSLFNEVKNIEREMGRTESERNAPREIDIDIVFYDDLILEMPELVIPHPLMHERSFVLAPLQEIDAFHEHPILRKPMIELWDELGAKNLGTWEAQERL